MMKKMFGFFLVLSFLYSCGGDGVPASTTSVNDNESKSIFEALIKSWDVGTEQVSELSKLSVKLLNATSNVEKSIQCENGGTSNVQGSSSFSGDSTKGMLSVNATRSFDQCNFDVEQEAKAITLNGQINQKLNLSGSESSFSITLKILGAVEVLGLEAGDGTCGIGLTISFRGENLESSSVFYDVDGSICGQSIEQSGRVL